jgi:hypothetical protein
MTSRASLEAVVKRKKIFLPCWELNPGHSAHSLVTVLSELSQLLLPENESHNRLKNKKDPCVI